MKFLVLQKKNKAPQISDSGYSIKESDIVPQEKRKYDIVILGATGFTGGLAVRHLAKTYGVNKDVKWAIAGRSKTKLEFVKKQYATELGLDEIVMGIDTIVVDTTDPETLPSLVKDTKVVATTAGPFQDYGSYVIEFCAKFGTHYVDITGEVEWVKTMQILWEPTAQKTGAKMISLCGLDSVPWDLTVMKLAEILREKRDEDLVSVSCWDEVEGEASGGTLATMLNIIDGKGVKAPLAEFDPFLRLPDGSKSPRRTILQPPALISSSIRPSEKEKTFTVPTVMSTVNFEVVKRSNALRKDAASSMLYCEVLACPDFKTAVVRSFGQFAGFSLLLNPLTGYFVRKWFLPQPGSGPSLSNMLNKYFLCVVAEGIGSKGSKAESVLYFNQDAGYLHTARMLIECGLCMAKDNENLPVKNGGFWTPSTALGNVLLERLCRTGTYFESRLIPSDTVS